MKTRVDVYRAMETAALCPEYLEQVQSFVKKMVKAKMPFPSSDAVLDMIMSLQPEQEGIAMDFLEAMMYGGIVRSLNQLLQLSIVKERM